MKYTNSFFEEIPIDYMELYSCYDDYFVTNYDTDMVAYVGGSCDLMNSNLNVYASSYYNEACSYSSSIDAVNQYICNNDNGYDEFSHMFNGMPVQLYDSKGRYVYIPLTDGAAEYSLTPETNIDHMEGSVFTISRIQTILINGEYGVDLLYIHSNDDQSISGYYQLLLNNRVRLYHTLYSADPPDGYIQVLWSVNCHRYAVQLVENDIYSNDYNEPNSTYDNYCKDMRSWQYYNCSYETYMQNIIDSLIDNTERETTAGTQ